MRTTLFFIFIISACHSERQLEPQIPSKSSSFLVATKPLYSGNAWDTNQELAYFNDTLVFEYYKNTFLVTGVGKYLSPSNDCVANTFYGESLVKSPSETINEFIVKLKEARSTFCDQSSEHCSDRFEYYRSEQNLHIIEAYYLYKAAKFEEGFAKLTNNESEWESSARYTDLYIAFLLQKYNRKTIEKELLAQIIELNHSIEIKGIMFNWVTISAFHQATYSKNDWKSYFKNTMDRIEEFGI